jgi:hypothetical protein
MGSSRTQPPIVEPEAFAQLKQLAGHAAVDQLVPDTDDDAADDARVDRCAHSTSFTEQIVEPRAHEGQFFGPQRHGRRQVADRDPAPFEEHVVGKPGRICGSCPESPALDQQADQIEGQRLPPRAEQALHECAASRVRDLWGGQKIRDRLIAERLGKDAQVALPPVERSLLVGHLEAAWA